MAKIEQIELVQDGQRQQYYLSDVDTSIAVAAMQTRLNTLIDSNSDQDTTLATLTEAVMKLTNANTETEATLTDYDERITKAENSAESASSRYASLSVSVDSNTQKIADEVERAKAVEGERDQLTASDNETLVSAINWVQTRAEKAIENVGTLSDLTTSEKTDVVLAINELVAGVTKLQSWVNAYVLDTDVTSDGTNPVTGKGIKTAITKAVDKVSATMQTTADALYATDENISAKVTTLEEKVATIAEKVGVSFDTDSEASSASETGDITSDTTEGDSETDTDTAQ